MNKFFIYFNVKYCFLFFLKFMLSDLTLINFGLLFALRFIAYQKFKVFFISFKTLHLLE